MLKRIRIQGYKSLADVDVRLKPLSVLLGPNAAGKSNFLDALQLLSRIATNKTLREAFEPPYRGKPLESFSLCGTNGLNDLLQKENAKFSIEADIELSEGVVQSVNRQILEMRKGAQGEGDDTNGDKKSGSSPGSGKLASQSSRRPRTLLWSEDAGQTSASQGRRSAEPKKQALVREKSLRYRVEIEILPKSGILRVSDESLAALAGRDQVTKSRHPFFDKVGDKFHVRMEGQARPTYYERYLDHTILSQPFYPPHYPHIVAAREELSRYNFFYFEPRERMRASNPVKEVRHIGLMGEELAAFLNTLKSLDPRQFKGVEKSLQMIVPSVTGIDVVVNNLGEVDLWLTEGSLRLPARVVSEGTLRVLGLLALTGAKDPPSLVGFEEPENGIHPRRVRDVAELLKTRSQSGDSQLVVTTHSPVLLDLLPSESLFICRKEGGLTTIKPFGVWELSGRREDIDHALDEPLAVSERLMRGDFDA
jgi:predicted ATPase